MPQKSIHNMAFLELQEFHLIIWNGTYRTNMEWWDKAKDGKSKKLFWYTVNKKGAPFLSAQCFLNWNPRMMYFQGTSRSAREIFNFVLSLPQQFKYNEYSHILGYLDDLLLT